jgi:hypothetical protein
VTETKSRRGKRIENDTMKASLSASSLWSSAWCCASRLEQCVNEDEGAGRGMNAFIVNSRAEATPARGGEALLRLTWECPMSMPLPASTM